MDFYAYFGNRFQRFAFCARGAAKDRYHDDVCDPGGGEWAGLNTEKPNIVQTTFFDFKMIINGQIVTYNYVLRSGEVV